MKSASKKTAPRQKSRAAIARTLLCIAPIALAGCSVFGPIPQNRGSLIEKDDYSQLVPGTSTRNDVTDLLGSPTTHSTFDDNTWIYISMVTVPQPLGFPRVTKQNVLVLAFDNGGVLRRVDTLHRKNGYNVGMVGETTPTPGTKVNVLQQLLGNVGRYNPMSNMGSTFGGTQGPLGAGVGTGHGGTGNSIP
ncbi:outer membrane protein assembly factor BamE [Asaia krungthepensis]|uniref:Lipoprotein OmlA n=1 Tax=Asaia krungthepensis NRIC 0535 TaxID=1307925 RepID=A0ABQ0Q1Q5_9PROT|nr:outer membrane protein assembly factor BamE [Asaia krungthepensis]GBQ87226.1 lipoprotein OmlA [Asaia krungthepensis NRIC 0535]